MRPSFIPWTRKAHELALHARERGRFEAIHWAIFEGYFERGGDIGRVDVLVEMAGAHGLREAEVRTVLGVDRFLPAVEEWRREAFAAGIGGVPTVDVGGRRLEGLSSVARLFSFLDDAVRASDRDRG
jgi:predicted DsbA family dithiol-disulfide isomerase